MKKSYLGIIIIAIISVIAAVIFVATHNGSGSQKDLKCAKVVKAGEKLTEPRCFNAKVEH